MFRQIYFLLAAVVFSCSSAVPLQAGSCFWTPSNFGDIPVDADITISAEPGDPAPSGSGFCECDGSDPVDWSATGNYDVSLSGDVSGNKLNTSTSGSKTVTANISFEYVCDVSGDTKWEADVGNPWSKTYTVSNYWISGPSRVNKDEQVSYTVESSAGTPPTVTSWDTSGGTQSGSGATIQVTWSAAGEKGLTATVDSFGQVSLGVDVMGDLVVEIESPSDPHVVAKDEPVTFVAKEPTGGVGPYTYEWSFENGTAPAGAKFHKTASGVKFGGEAEGKENTVTLTVRDSQGDSGMDSVIVAVPKIEIASVAPENKILANTPEYTSLTDGTVAVLTVSILPSSVKNMVKSDISLKIDEANPNTTNKGIISSVGFIDTGEFLYLTKKEKKTHKDAQTDPMLKQQTIKLGLYREDSLVDGEELTVHSFFNYLTDINSDFDTALGIVNIKYDLGITSNLSGGGAGSYAIPPANYISVSMGHMANENLCASTLIHESTHIAQGTATFLNAIEAQMFWGGDSYHTQPEGTTYADFIPIARLSVALWANAEIEAHNAEIANFGHTKLREAERDGVYIDKARYEAIKTMVTAP